VPYQPALRFIPSRREIAVSVKSSNNETARSVLHPTICQLARRQPKIKEPFMKMHLVMTAAFAGLCSHAAFAASEGGDTWSALQPQAYARSIQSPAMAASSSKLQGASPIAASEGGDTWSSLQAKAYAGSTQSNLVATGLSSGRLQRSFAITGSEGGDTWSELQTRALGDAAPSLMAGR
jgi:hypothetical protein